MSFYFWSGLHHLFVTWSGDFIYYSKLSKVYMAFFIILCGFMKTPSNCAFRQFVHVYFRMPMECEVWNLLLWRDWYVLNIHFSWKCRLHFKFERWFRLTGTLTNQTLVWEIYHFLWVFLSICPHWSVISWLD